MTRQRFTARALDAQNGSWLATKARRALYAPGFATGRGLCQRWVREVVQSLHGGKYDAYHKGTAHESMQAWKHSPYAVAPSSGSIIGDILYKAGTPNQRAGHVGIRIKGNLVAENSSVHRGRNGARGTRTLAQFGEPDLIVRLPEK